MSPRKFPRPQGSMLNQSKQEQHRTINIYENFYPKWIKVWVEYRLNADVFPA